MSLVNLIRDNDGIPRKSTFCLAADRPQAIDPINKIKLLLK